MQGGVSVPAGGRLLQIAAVACRSLASLLLALICVLIAAQVAGRNLFNTGMPWADELARFCGVAIVFLCVPLLALRGQHVAMDLASLVLRGRLRRPVALVIELTVLAFACLGLWSLHAFLGRAWKFATPTLGIPNWVFYAPALVGLALLALVAVARIRAIVAGRLPDGNGSPVP
ncbi:TRAP-type C4-dicarboxylate transport system permease small subunit [Tepidamorphus gemmatus]|uniref:TRAP transporter small permease protein n=1 Tax=Tepidamorphus gemmatus TaxID=747076 RepID=A0A4R3MB32_9HYPH|nr:TRAP transporter small permease subunit [Tepidamorphus gemmatus]TCT09933.1 TRAP-type C4-dicarboxylate transport system permease small subunit [Tepidamorphus gemmatus]